MMLHHASENMFGKLPREFRRHPLMRDTDKEGEYPVEDKYDPGRVSVVQDFMTSV